MQAVRETDAVTTRQTGGPPATDASPSSTTAVSRYINIATMRATAPPSQRAPVLPPLHTRLPNTTTDSVRPPPQYRNDHRESSLVLSESHKTDASMQKYLRQLVEDLESSNTVTVLQAPPVDMDDSDAEDEHVDDGPLGDPALAAVGLFTGRHVGLLLSVACASMLTSCLKRGVLPLMRSELQMAPYQADAAEVLVMLPWASMFVLGFVSDCLPLFRSHRKSYVVAGWTLVVVSLFALALVTYAHAQAAANEAAHSAAFVNGAVFLLGVACFGGILTVVMAEVYFLAMSKRERLLERGKVVGTLLLVQSFFETVGQTLTTYVVFQTTAVGVQPLYTLQEITVFLSLASLLPLFASAFFFQEDTELMRTGSVRETELEQKTGIVDTLQAHARVVWATLQRESTWRVVRFLALFVFFSECAVRYAHLVLDEVCGVTLPVVSTGKIIAELLTFGTVLVWRLFLLNADWKWLATISFVVAAWLPQLTYFLFVLLNVSRDVGIYTLVSSTKAIVRGIVIVLQVAMAVEIAPRGAEGATAGAVMSVATIARLLATTVSNALSFAFDAQTLTTEGLDVQLSLAEEIKVARDPTTIQLPASLERRVLFALLVGYSVKLLACGGVGFLPRQKQHLQWLHRFGPTRPRHAVWTVGLLCGSLLVAVTFNALVVTPRTSCLRAFGGKGCAKDT